MNYSLAGGASNLMTTSTDTIKAKVNMFLIVIVDGQALLCIILINEANRIDKR